MSVKNPSGLYQLIVNVDQTFRKLHFGWDKLNEYLEENRDEVKQMASEEVAKFKEEAKNTVKNLEESLSNADSKQNKSSENQAADLQKELSEFWQNIKSKIADDSESLSKNIKETENKMNWENAKNKADFNLKAANMHFNASLKNLQKAVKAYSEAVESTLDNN